MNASSDATGRESADAGRAERVAHIGALIGVLYGLATSLDLGKAADAVKGLTALEKLSEALRACVFEEIRQQAAAARERERSSETVHGEDSEAAEVKPSG